MDRSETSKNPCKFKVWIVVRLILPYFIEGTIFWSDLESWAYGFSYINEVDISSIGLVVDGYGWMVVNVVLQGPLHIFCKEFVVGLQVTSYFKRILDTLFNFSINILKYFVLSQQTYFSPTLFFLICCLTESCAIHKTFKQMFFYEKTHWS